ncbi:Meiotic Crossover Helicase [Abortiporus biennis]
MYQDRRSSHFRRKDGFETDEYDLDEDYYEDSGISLPLLNRQSTFYNDDSIHEQYDDYDEPYSSPCPAGRHNQSARSELLSHTYQPLSRSISSQKYDYEDMSPSPQYQISPVFPRNQPQNMTRFQQQQQPTGSFGTQRQQPYTQRTFMTSTQSQPIPLLQPFPQASSHQSARKIITELESSATSPGNERGSNPRNSHGIRLRPVTDLPDIYRGLFKFGVFNAVQSACFDTIMHSNENMVVSAPTGSGKTVLFELAIIRVLTQTGGSRTTKCIYVAPTKALCSEKYRDWATKFQPLGIKCCEMTGDTIHFGTSAWADAKDATIIVTTGEKWDSLTRNWDEHDKLLSEIGLFLVDEVHILNETRGSTLEVVVSRMKTRGKCVRLVFVSATVPNIHDVAGWIGGGRNGGSATVKEFGEEYRPCKLSKFVYGVPRRQNQNDFQFLKSLDYKLYAILQQHAANKPVLVFSATRRSVTDTAEQLLKEYEQATQQKKTLPWNRPRRIDHNFNDKKLDKLAGCGIGIHHAGMTMDDRRATEDLYLKKILRVVVATSTLAVGVNLPAHTVVIKGVKMFQANGMQEYSDLDIMQMMGRAGRPQFDKEGVAIILCESDLEAKYKALVHGQTLLESCLHLNLTEHLNSEIGLGTIQDIPSAKNWLHNSFLYQRIQKNPRHYSVTQLSGGNVNENNSWHDQIDQMVMQSVETLKATELVEETDDGNGLRSTGFGEIMSRYYLRHGTMSLILALPERPSLRDMLEVVSASSEYSDIKFRSGEKQIYNKIKDHNDVRFKVKKIEKPADKIFLIIQAILGGINLNDSEYKNGDNQPSLEALTVFRHVLRIARAVVEIAILKDSGAQVKHGLEMLRCLSAKAWEDRPTVLRQIEQIGEKSIKV